MNAQVKPAETDNTIQLPAVRKDKEVRVVSDPIPVLDTARFEHMQRIAQVMAASNLIPESLSMTGDSNNRQVLPTPMLVANCFLVVNQAVRWGMDPFAVAQCVSVIHGKLCYEGKLIAAVIEAKLGIRLRYEWDNKQGDSLGIVVSGKFHDEQEPRTVSGTVGEWKTTGAGTPWVPKQFKKMLAYRGAREWGRLHCPSLMLGVYSEDELEMLSEDRRARSAREIVAHDDGPPAPPPRAITHQQLIPEVAAPQSDVELVEAGRDDGKQVVWDETTGEIKEPTAAFDEAQWLRDLEGALGGCNDFASLAEKQGAIMMPEKSRASAEGWAKAKALISANLDRINEAAASA